MCEGCACSSASVSKTRTIVVLGAAYGGAHAAQILAESLPPDWRVVAIDRNSHMNHVYVFPRFIVKPQHAPKGFVPYRRMFTKKPHAFLQGHITALSANSVTVLLPHEGRYDDVADNGSDAPPERLVHIPFDYCIYALGAGLPAPCDVWGEYGRTQLPGRGTKTGGVRWMEEHCGVIAKADRIAIVGAGPLGIQFASDIKDMYPSKTVTLIHSRERMMPRYPAEMHDIVVAGLQRVGVDLILGERVTSWPADPLVLDGRDKTITTETGRTVTADIVLACTGQKPHAELLASLDPRAIAPNGRIRVRGTTQVDVTGGKDLDEAVAGLRLDSLDHIFAIGDCANTTAIQAGHTAYWQGEVAARNIQRLIDNKRCQDPNVEVEELEVYAPGAPAIKVTLGLSHYVISSGEVVTAGQDGVEDLDARAMWPIFNAAEAADDE